MSESGSLGSPEEGKKKRRWSLRRKLFFVVLLAVIGVVAVILFAEGYVATKASGQLYESVDDVPEQGAGLVLGCAPTLVDGRPNLYFVTRMDAAAELWQAGKVRFLILSGDNSEKYYNEPREMFKALQQRGVPGEKMVLDFAGFRTLDSVVRAKKIFGVSDLVVVSQPFHNERAVAIARHFDYSAVGYNADEVVGMAGTKTWARERLARVKLLLDLFILDKQPKYLGEKEQTPDGENGD